MPDTLKILIVDDIYINHVILESILLGMGHKVESAKTGTAAIEAVKRQDFDFILMDINMPEMDGIAVTRMIRKLPVPKSRIPIIACTADNSEKHVKQYRKAGMNGLIGKPIIKEELNLALDNSCYGGFHFQDEADMDSVTSDLVEEKSRNTAEVLSKLLKEIGG